MPRPQPHGPGRPAQDQQRQQQQPNEPRQQAEGPEGPEGRGPEGGAPPPHVVAHARARALLQRASPADAEALAVQLAGGYHDIAAALQLLAAAVAAAEAGGPRPPGLSAAQPRGRSAHDTRGAAARRRAADASMVVAERLAAALAERAAGRAGARRPSAAGAAGHTRSGRSGDAGCDPDCGRAGDNGPLSDLPAAALASITLSLGRLRLYDPACVAALEARSRQLLGRCSPNQLGQIAEGLEGLGHTPAAEWREAFTSAAGAALPRCGATQLASIAGAVAGWRRAAAAAEAGAAAPAGGAVALAHAPLRGKTAGSPAQGTAAAPSAPLPRAWLDAYCAAAARAADAELAPSMITRLLTAAAGLGVLVSHADSQGPLQPPMTGAAGDRLASKEQQQHQQQQQQQQQRQQCGDGFAAEMTAALLARLEARLPDARPRELADCLLALADMSAGPCIAARFRRLALLQVQLQLPLATGPDIVDALWGLQRLGVNLKDSLSGSANGPARGTEPPPAAMAPAHAGEWADAVLLRLYAAMPSLNASRLARLGALLGCLLRRQPPALWRAEYYQRLRVEAASMAPAELVDCLEGLSAVRLPLDDETLSRAAAAARTALPRLDAAGLRRAAGALRRMYGKMPGRKMQGLLEEMERRAAWQ
jgi:hypothetical protein